MTYDERLDHFLKTFNGTQFFLYTEKVGLADLVMAPTQLTVERVPTTDNLPRFHQHLNRKDKRTQQSLARRGKRLPKRTKWI